jgi:O-antigen/teichoic acid export membrane protein
VVETSAEPAKNPARQAGALIVGTTLATLSSVLLPVMLVRLMGKADIAELMALVLIYDMVALIATGGFAQVLMYHLPGRPETDRRAVAVRIGLILTALGALGALVVAAVGVFGARLPGALSSHGGAQLSLRPLLILAPALIFDLPSKLVPTLLVAEGRATTASALGVVRTIATTITTLVPVAMGCSMTTVVLWYSLTRCVFGLSLPWAIRQSFPKVDAVPCTVGVKDLFRFALPLGATDVVSLLNQQVDRWLILLSFPAAAFADYQAGAWQVPVLGTIAYSVGDAYMPSLVQHFGRGENKAAIEIWRGTIGKVSLIVVPITVGFMVGARELMSVLFTDAYVSAAVIFQLYSVMTLGRVATFGSVIIAAGRPRYMLQAAVFSLVANLALCVPLTRAVGFVGPALGTSLAFIPMVVFYVWSIARATNLRTRDIFPARDYFRVLGLSGVAGAVAYFAKTAVPGPKGFKLLLAILVTMLVFALLGSVTGVITQGDWRLARSWMTLRLARRARRPA